MKSIVYTLAFTLGIALLAAAPQTAQAQDRPVLQSILVDVKPGQQAAYLEKIKQIGAISARLQNPPLRVWQGTAAGENTGRLVIVIEHANLAAYAASTSRSNADPEFQKVLASLGDGKLREIVSNSLWAEVTP